MASCLPSSQTHDTINGGQTKLDADENKDIISTLPRTNTWSKSDHSFAYQYQGFWYDENFLRGILSAQDRFQAKSTDIILATPPKTGTTWLKALTFAIATRNRFDDTNSPLLVKLPHACLPFLELDLVGGPRDPDVPLVSTHLPYSSLPKSIVQEGCKILFLWRDAKDTFVSNWFYAVNTLKSSGMEADKLISMEQAFDMFCQGLSFYGPYWDHVLSYWKAKQENPDKILFLKYEELKKDTEYYVKKLAEFMDYPFTIEEEENGVVQKVIDMCSFNKLRNLEVNKSGKYEVNSWAVEHNSYFREGRVGDWSNYLTPEMGERLDLIMENKLKDSGLAI